MEFLRKLQNSLIGLKTILKATNLFPGLLEQTGNANRSTQAGGEKGTIFTERSSLLVNNCKGK